MLSRSPLDQPLALQSIQAVQGGFIGNNLAVRLDFPDKGGAAMFIKMPLDELKDDLLFIRERNAGQRNSKTVQKMVISTLRYYYLLQGESMKGLIKKI